MGDDGTSQDAAERRELFELGRAMIERCQARGIELAVYGSLAYLALTGDAAEGVNDIDFLVDEAWFPIILSMLSLDSAFRAEPTSYGTIKVFRGGAKVSFDSISRYLAGLAWTQQTHEIDGLAFEAVDPATLIEVYRRGAATIAQNRQAYLRKLAGLGAAE